MDIAISIIALLLVGALVWRPALLVAAEVAHAAREGFRDWWIHAAMVALMFVALSFVE